MKRLVLMIGIPGSGKTTLAQKLVEEGFVRLCADDIRFELWGNEAEQKEPEKVFQLFFERLEKALNSSLDIVIDNTNTNPKHREPILERARKAGYSDIELWFFDTPLEICLERNKARARAVPEEIVCKMHTTINGYGKPKPSEGKIIIIKDGL